jgi:hypothetical protein
MLSTLALEDIRYPPEISLHLLEMPQVEECLECEGSVPDPGETVIPVPASSNNLRK